MAGDGRAERHPASSASGHEERPRRSRKSHRIDEVFGDVLPETTSDERDPGPGGSSSEDWYLENRPPHHGG